MKKHIKLLNSFILLSLFWISFTSCKKGELVSIKNLEITQDEAINIFGQKSDSYINVTSTNSIRNKAINSESLNSFSLSGKLKQEANNIGNLYINDVLIPKNNSDINPLNNSVSFSQAYPQEEVGEHMIDLYGTDVSLTITDENDNVLVEEEFYSPKEIIVFAPYNESGTINLETDVIRWNKDDSNELGVFLVLKEDFVGNVENTLNASTNYILTEDDGEFPVSELAANINSPGVMLMVYRGNIINTKSGELDYQLNFHSSNTQFYVVDKTQSN